MIDSKKIKSISKIFIGDDGAYYPYKTGSELVEFFNKYFSCNDQYGGGFPSRWAYVADKLDSFMNTKKINKFFTIALNKDYLMSEWQITAVEAVQKKKNILDKFNEILSPAYYIIQKEDENWLIDRNNDLTLIGSGGFADVYKQTSTNYAVKKLKEDLLYDEKACKRFKREFQITQNLSRKIDGIINVINFNENRYEYTMELAECTLEQFINKNNFSNVKKEQLIRETIRIMADVHNHNVIHRDLSPSNIFIVGGSIKIGDFGLGKNLKGVTMCQTTRTANVGRFYYTAPEQLSALKDGDKKSDVFALGRVINFIMNKDPLNSHHYLKAIVDKATVDDSQYRYSDAREMLKAYDCFLTKHNEKEYKNVILDKIKNRIFDEDMQQFIDTLNDEEQSQYLLEYKKDFLYLLLKFMDLNKENALEVVSNINRTYRKICQGTYEYYDIFSDLAFEVLNNQYAYNVQDIAADILVYIAYTVRRFRTGDQIKKLQNKGLEPLLEEKLVRF